MEGVIRGVSLMWDVGSRGELDVGDSEQGGELDVGGGEQGVELVG